MPKGLVSSFHSPIGNSRKGFTLIEVLVVVAIMGILLSLSVAGLRGAQSSARDTDRKTDLEDIKSALEIYRTDCGYYPDGPLLWGGILSANCAGSLNTYMAKVPQDPQNLTKLTKYEYVKLSANTYTLCAYTEHGKNPLANCAGSPTANCGPNGCNYSVTNP